MFRLFWVIFRPFKKYIQVYQCLWCILGSRTLTIGGIIITKVNVPTGIVWTDILYYVCRSTCCWLRWSRGSVLAFSTQVQGFKPARSLRIFKGEKILSKPSFGGEVKPSVPCRRSLNSKITGQHSHPQFHLWLLGSLASLRTWRHL